MGFSGLIGRGLVIACACVVVPATVVVSEACAKSKSASHGHKSGKSASKTKKKPGAKRLLTVKGKPVVKDWHVRLSFRTATASRVTAYAYKTGSKLPPRQVVRRVKAGSGQVTIKYLAAGKYRLVLKAQSKKRRPVRVAAGVVTISGYKPSSAAPSTSTPAFKPATRPVPSTSGPSTVSTVAAQAAARAQEEARRRAAERAPYEERVASARRILNEINARQGPVLAVRRVNAQAPFNSDFFLRTDDEREEIRLAESALHYAEMAAMNSSYLGDALIHQGRRDANQSIRRDREQRVADEARRNVEEVARRQESARRDEQRRLEANQARLAEAARADRSATEARLAREAEEARLCERARIEQAARDARNAQEARVAEQARAERVSREAEAERVAQAARASQAAREAEEQRLSDERRMMENMMRYQHEVLAEAERNRAAAARASSGKSAQVAADGAKAAAEVRSLSPAEEKVRAAGVRFVEAKNAFSAAVERVQVALVADIQREEAAPQSAAVDPSDQVPAAPRVVYGPEDNQLARNSANFLRYYWSVLVTNANLPIARFDEAALLLDEAFKEADGLQPRAVRLLGRVRGLPDGSVHQQYMQAWDRLEAARDSFESKKRKAGL